MATSKSVRVFITDARLSYPALDEPKETMAGNGDRRYQATFLIAPDNPCVKTLWNAIKEVASAAYGDRANAVLKTADKIPLKKGDDKEKIPDGYAGMLYINAKSKNAPELRDANPKIMIRDKETIKEKFVAGYRVNAYIDLYAYTVKNPNGSILKSGIAAGLVSVQFKAYADPFSSRTATSDSDYPDCTADAEKSQGYDKPVATDDEPAQGFLDTMQDDGEDIPF